MSRSTSRGEAWRTRFDPELAPRAYTSENLNAFVIAAGREYLKKLDDLLEKERKALKQRGASPVEVREALKQVRYDYVSLLDSEELIPTIPKKGEASKAKAITEKDIENLYKKGLGIADVLDLIERTPVEDFNTNALSRAATLLRVPGITAATKGLTKDAKKEAIKDLILGRRREILALANVRAEESAAREGLATAQDLQDLSDEELDIELDDMGLSTAGTREEKIKRLVESQPKPSMAVRYNRPALESMRIPELKSILKGMGKTQSGKKSELVERILANQGAAGQVPIGDLISNIIEEALAGRTLQMRARVSSMPADAFDSASVPELKKLAKALDVNIKGLTRKADIIRALTNKTPSRELLASRSREIRSTLFDCLSASEEEIHRVADELGIRWRGRDQETICNEIYENYLSKFTNLFLTEVGAGKIDLQKVANMPEKTRATEIARIARRAGFENVNSIQSLLRAFLVSHYRVRALRFAPHVLGVVTRFLDTGAIPNDEADLEDMARVFGDLNPELLSLDARGIAQALDLFYKSFVIIINEGREGNLAAILRRIHEFGYHAAVRGRGGQAEVFAREEFDVPNRAPIIEEVHEFVYPGEAEEILPGLEIREENGNIQVRENFHNAVREEIQQGRISPREAQELDEEFEIPEAEERFQA